MTTSTSLIDFLLSLLRDPDALAAYQDDPEGYLASCGLEGISPAEVHDALVLIEDNQEADFSRDYNTGGNHSGTVHVPPPPPAPHPAPGQSEHEAAIQYINNYVTNNFIDDRDVITDNSINQQIDTGGGDFDQDIDIDSVVAAGDGSVAAGGDIDGSTIVTGDDNTTSFGSGDATSVDVGGDLSADDGSSIAIGGDSSVDNSDNSVNDSFNDNSDNSTNDSFNNETDVDVDVDDSFNDNSDNSVEDSGNDNSDNSIDNSTTFG